MHSKKKISVFPIFLFALTGKNSQHNNPDTAGIMSSSGGLIFKNLMLLQV